MLTATTHFVDVLRALRAFRLPAILVAILSFAYRYLFILTEEAQRLLRARECRSAALDGKGGGSVVWRAKVTGRLVGTLFLRAFERSERVYVAMVSRGYAGEIRSLQTTRLVRQRCADRRGWHADPYTCVIASLYLTSASSKNTSLRSGTTGMDGAPTAHRPFRPRRLMGKILYSHPRHGDKASVAVTPFELPHRK